MEAFWTALALVFVAEMGDKTQFMTVALAAKYKGRVVMSGVCLGTLLVSLFSVLLGETVGRLLPYFWINLLAGLVFIIFGAVAFFSKEDEEKEKDEASDELNEAEKKFGLHRLGPILSIAGAFFIAELGDKTMLATVAIAGKEYQYFYQVWFGSTLGLVLANALGLIAGKSLAAKLSAKTLRYLVAITYVVSGLLAISEAFKLRG